MAGDVRYTGVGMRPIGKRKGYELYSKTVGEKNGVPVCSRKICFVYEKKKE